MCRCFVYDSMGNENSSDNWKLIESEYICVWDRVDVMKCHKSFGEHHRKKNYMEIEIKLESLRDEQENVIKGQVDLKASVKKKK